ncbi:MAG: thermopsin [Ferroplasma sp.]|uniref:thermopsin n=1 Tax=Ferroplasma sp. TaxID=2591003 RepID=UPI0028154C45|nr:thermopsin [Ferroplasma sp.]WMT50906.1 MAG: thermopsin [Ferroplasma sp.]
MSKYISVAIAIILTLLMVTVIYAGTPGHQESDILPATVSPSAYYHNEPAPMGIADYGINSSSNGFYFNSTSFEGGVIITNLTTYNSSISSCPSNAGTQLNLIYRFSLNGQNYTYWVQNVAILNTSSRQVAFIDNVWNFTSANSEMHHSSIVGNGTVYKSSSGVLYYYRANGGYFESFSYKQLQLRSVSFIKSGFPHIYMEYNSGNGWVTYDTLNFTFAGNMAADYGFIVNGNQLNNNNLPIDAGLIIGGPGDGADTRAINVNVIMYLECWNGHNYQAVEDAYNHGSDTAEGICNITENYVSYNNIPAVDIRSGNGSPGELYTSSSISILNFNPGISSGYVSLNRVMFNFTGSAIDLSLFPGHYNFSLYTENGQKIFQDKFNLSAGKSYTMSTRQTYYVAFNETGLENGTSWSVSVDGSILSSNNHSIVFTLYNGTYNYSVAAVSGYSTSNNNGTVVVNGTSPTVNVTFTKIPAVVNKTLAPDYGYKLLITLIIVGIVIIGIMSVFLRRRPK